jgi:hypothetical protein
MYFMPIKLVKINSHWQSKCDVGDRTTNGISQSMKRHIYKQVLNCFGEISIQSFSPFKSPHLAMAAISASFSPVLMLLLA